MAKYIVTADILASGKHLKPGDPAPRKLFKREEWEQLKTEGFVALVEEKKENSENKESEK